MYKRQDLTFKTKTGVALNTSDDAEVVFPNRFLSKGTEFIPDGAYMKYTILVNENRIPFANDALTVEDDLGQLITHIVDKDGKGSTIIGLDNVWTYEQEMTKVKMCIRDRAIQRPISLRCCISVSA